MNNSKDRPTLSEDLRSLIIRKLRHQRRELQRRLAGATREAYSTLGDEISTHVRAREPGQALVSAPLAAYKEIVATATAATRDWPVIVWETTASLLEKGQAAPGDGQELNTIVDEFTWSAEQEPFTLEYIESERFRESVYRMAERYGRARDDRITEIDRQLDLAAAAARAGIVKTASQAREGIGIRIEEYLLAQGQRGPTATPAETSEYHQPSTARREVRKQGTQAMYKEWHRAYRVLKREHPNMSDVWYAERIARMDIAKGRNSDTIRKRMKR